MAKLLRLLILLSLAFALVALLALAGFRGLALFRETAEPAAATGEGARFVEVEGIVLHYRQWGPDDGPPLILIHGTLAWAETWRDIARPLGEAGFRVLAPDLPPFGYSQRPLDGDYSRAAQARLILRFAEILHLGRFALAGHSYGGGATVEAAMSAPDRISALVLLDVAIGLDATSPGSLQHLLSIRPLRDAVAAATFANPWLTGIGLRAFIADDAPASPERIALYRQPLAVKGTSSAIGDWLSSGLFGDTAAARSIARENYRELPVPTLVVWGREDTVTPLAQGEELAALIPGARLVVLDRVNHIPHLEQPSAVAHEMLSFLRHSKHRSSEEPGVSQ